MHCRRKACKAEMYNYGKDFGPKPRLYHLDAFENPSRPYGKSSNTQWAQPPYPKKPGPAGWSLYVSQPAGLKIESPADHSG
jgi:hypothetical protein